MQATTIGEPAAMQDGDVAVFMNFRADRARELPRQRVDEIERGLEALEDLR